MFTGLVESLGVVRGIEPNETGCRLVIAEPEYARSAEIGASIAVNGACLTVIHRDAETVEFQAVHETLQKTNLGELAVGDRVNLERSLRMGDPLGGHWVQGHVDGTGTIARREPEGDGQRMWFACDPELARQMVSKGSITVDGISLTVVDVSGDGFSVALIPHTLAVTTLGFKSIGAKVNLETDVLAKYVWKYLQAQKE